MTQMMHDGMRVVLIGVGATTVMDAWLLVLKRRQMPTVNFALLGRWFGHALAGRWKHEAIARAAPIHGELALGWSLHYTVGIAFAAMLVGFCGMAWTRDPSVLPALIIGALTVAAPLLVIQPAMGAGVASSRTSAPLRNSLRSLANHIVFGAGLYLSAVLIAWIAP